MNCKCDRRANFRAEECKKCGQNLNGAEPMSIIAHMKVCIPSKEYKDRMKKIGEKLKADPEFMKAIKDFGKKK